MGLGLGHGNTGPMQQGERDAQEMGEGGERDTDAWNKDEIQRGGPGMAENFRTRPLGGEGN